MHPALEHQDPKPYLTSEADVKLVDQMEDALQEPEIIRKRPRLSDLPLIHFTTDLTGLPLPALRRLYTIVTMTARLVVYFFPLIPFPRELWLLVESVSTLLDLPPVPTYAGLVLWNWERTTTDYDASVCLPRQFRVLYLLTGLEAEENFYRMMICMEYRAGRMYSHSITPLEIYSVLTQACYYLSEINSDHCDPTHFYYVVRPLYKPVTYRGEMDTEYVGPSAVQSPAIHFIDLCLGTRQSSSYGQLMRSTYVPKEFRELVEDGELALKLHTVENEWLLQRCREQLLAFRMIHRAVVQKYVEVYKTTTGTGGTELNAYLGNAIQATRRTMT